MHQIVCAKPYRSCLFVALYFKTNLRVRAHVEHGWSVKYFNSLVSTTCSAVEHLAYLFHGAAPRLHDFFVGTPIPSYLSVSTVFSRLLMPRCIEATPSRLCHAVLDWYYATTTGVCYA